jgi:hypothetical protein
MIHKYWSYDIRIDAPDNTLILGRFLSVVYGLFVDFGKEYSNQNIAHLVWTNQRLKISCDLFLNIYETSIWLVIASLLLLTLIHTSFDT